MKNPNKNKNYSETKIQLFVFDPSLPNSSEHVRELNLKVEFNYSIGNDSFDHAFGTQVYPDYIEDIYNIKMSFLNPMIYDGVDYQVGNEFPIEKFIGHIDEDSYIVGAKDAEDFIDQLTEKLVNEVELQAEEYEPDLPDFID